MAPRVAEALPDTQTLLWVMWAPPDTGAVTQPQLSQAAPSTISHRVGSGVGTWPSPGPGVVATVALELPKKSSGAG